MAITNKSADALFSLINKENHCLLRKDDFDLVSLSTNIGKQNTKIIIKPIENSRYIGNITLYYNRQDLSVLLESKQYTSYRPTSDKTNLYAILPELSEKLGITITEDDVNDVTFTSSDQWTGLYPITITAKSDSLLYIGSGVFYLGNKPTLEENDILDDKTKTIWMYTAALSASTTDNAYYLVKRINPKTRVFDSSFTFCSNCNINSATISHIFAVGKYLMVFGNIDINAYLDGTMTHIVAKCIVLDQFGYIKYYTNLDTTSYTGVVHRPELDYLYVYTVSGNTTTINRIKTDGTVDSAYSVTINHTLTHIKLDKDGNFYIVKTIDSDATGPYLDIVRYTNTGDLDSTFNTVRLRAQMDYDGNYITPFDVEDIDIDNNHLDVYLKLIDPPIANGKLPLLDTTPLFDITVVPKTYAWLPILRFDKDGNKDIMIDNVLEYLHPDVIYKQTSNTYSYKDSVFTHTRYIQFLSHRVKSCTNDECPLPLTFEYRDNIIDVNHDLCLDTPIWTDITSAIKVSDNYVILSGRGKKIFNGNYTDERNFIVYYSKDLKDAGYVHISNPLSNTDTLNYQLLTMSITSAN